MRRIDRQLIVGIVAVLAGEATIVADNAAAHRNGASTRSSDNIQAGGDVQRTGPEAVLVATVGTDISLVGHTALQIVEHIECIGHRNGIRHRVGKESGSTDNQFKVVDTGRISPADVDTVSLDRVDNKRSGLGAARRSGASHINLESVVLDRAIRVEHHGDGTRREGTEVLGGADAIVVPKLFARGSDTVVDSDVVVGAFSVGSTGDDDIGARGRRIDDQRRLAAGAVGARGAAVVVDDACTGVDRVAT